MQFKTPIWVMTVCGLIVATAGGTEIRQLNLPKAISVALERNYDIISAEENLRMQRASTRIAYGNFLPNVGISASTSHSARTGPSLVDGEPIGPAITRTSSSYSAGIGGSITLFDGFNNFATLSRSRYNQSASEYNLENTERTVITQVINYYYNVFRTEQLLEVRREDLRRAEAQLERIEEANRVGMVPVVDVRRQEVEVGNAELEVIRAELNYQNTIADLIFYLGLNPIEQYELDPAGVPKDIDKDELISLLEIYSNMEALSGKALQYRPDLEAVRQQVYAAESGLTAARSGFWPSFSLSGNYGFTAEELAQLDESRNREVTLNISFPLFTRFNRSSNIEQAKASLNNAENQLNQMQNRTLLDLQKARSDLEAAAKLIDVTEKNIIAAEEEQRLAEERYHLGAGTLLDLIIANARLSNARMGNIEAIFNFYLTVNQMKLLTGEELY